MVNPLEQLYTGKCDIIQKLAVTDAVTHITQFAEAVAAKDVPCRLSHKTIAAANQGDVATVAQIVKLFISPAVKVLPGSRIIVTQAGVTKCYEASGEAAVYSRHQEIVLRLADDKA